MSNISHERVLALIELAIKGLGNGDDVTAVKVQAWLQEHHAVEVSIEQVNGDMQIVRDTVDGEWE